MTIGYHIRKYRISKGWTLQELGERSDLAANTLSAVENDKKALSIIALRRVASALGVDVDYLFK